jgi:hypothetical protein
MSALPPKADMCGATSDVRFGPLATSVGLAVHCEIVRSPLTGIYHSTRMGSVL